MPTLLQDAINDLSKKMEAALEESNDLDTRILSIHKLLKTFLSEYEFFEDKLTSIELGQWGTTRTFLEIGDKLVLKYNLRNLVTKRPSMSADYDEVPKSDLQMDLQDALDNSTFKWTRAERKEIEDLISNCSGLSDHLNFTENRDRLLEYYAQLSEDLREHFRVVSVNSTTFGKLIDALHFDTIRAIPQTTEQIDGEPQEEPTSPPKPAGNGNCSTIPDIFKPSELGEAIIITSIRKAIAEWPIGTAAAMKTYLKRVEVLLANNPEAIRPSIQTIQTFAGSNPIRGNLLKKVQISNWGTVEHLFIC
ncbi:hypothetical protein L596_026117 [Steinernema carpocapsae]|uniref:Uncharacterized protein n=1 Tax=Steinernema carpocapsae TaxID=34508 RepID=A0A4V5ZY33_STECR|nr:hypothetical protein L596_026117 [Steinernema carpocapsae]